MLTLTPTKKHSSVAKFFFGSVLASLALPWIASAQAYVPVQDIKLNPAFSQYVTDYFTRFDNTFGAATPNGTTDSLRDLISGSDPGNLAKAPCKLGDAEDEAFAFDKSSPWGMAFASSTTGLPATIPAGGSVGSPNGYVQVNKSASLRCLLQEMVGWQKLQLFVQFHSLLKTYIADAQQKQLSNQLLNKLNAANLNWAKSGVQIEQGGLTTTEPIYVTNLNDSVYNRKQRVVSTVIDQAAAPAGSPTGSLDLCDPLGTASQLAINQRSTAEDPRNYFNTVTSCTLAAPKGPFAGGSASDVEDYYQNANTSKGPGALLMLGYSLNNPQDFELTSAHVVEAETARRAALAEENYRQQLLGNGGLQPTQKCSGAPDDPNCDPDLAISVSPAAQNSAVITSAVQDNKAQIITANSLDNTVATSSQNAVVETNTGNGNNDGLLGFDPTAMQKASPQINKLISEFYDAIQYVYFDLNGDQEEWANAAMLNIYDSLSFSATEPTTAIPTAAGNNTPVNTGY